MGSDPAWVKATRAENRAAMVRCRKGWVVPEIPPHAQTPECQAATRSCQLNVAMQAEQGLGLLEIRAGKGPRSMRHRERSAAANSARQTKKERAREREKPEKVPERARARTHTYASETPTHPPIHPHPQREAWGWGQRQTHETKS